METVNYVTANLTDVNLAALDSWQSNDEDVNDDRPYSVSVLG